MKRLIRIWGKDKLTDIGTWLTDNYAMESDDEMSQLLLDFGEYLVTECEECDG